MRPCRAVDSPDSVESDSVESNCDILTLDSFQPLDIPNKSQINCEAHTHVLGKHGFSAGITSEKRLL